MYNVYNEPNHVSRKYIPVFLIRNVRAFIILILIYSIGPIVNGQAEQILILLPGLNLTVINGVLIAIILIIGLVLLFSILSYRKITWWIDGQNVIIKKGILRRVNKSIPISKIQSINITATLSERMFRTATVKIDTAGGEGDDGNIPCLDKEEAAKLRDIVFAIKHGAIKSAFSPEAETEETAGIANAEELANANTIYKLPIGNLWLTGISNAKAIVFGFIIMSVISQYAGVFSDLFMGGEDLYENAFEYAARMALPIIVMFIVIFFAISWFVSVLVVMAGNYGFTVRNIGNKIEIEKGLITHRIVSIEKQRVQEVRVRQGFIRRIIGYAEISVKTAILKDQTNTSSSRNNEEMLGITVIHPFISVKEVDYFVSRLLPDFSSVPDDLKPLPPGARLRSVRRYFGWSLIFIAAGWFIAFAAISSETGGEYFDWFISNSAAVIIPSAIVVAFFTFTGYRAYLGKGVSWNNDFLVVKNGAWAREWARIPRRKIQIATISENPFQRRVGLATLKGTTGALAFPSLMDVDLSYAHEYLSWAVTKKKDIR